MQENRLLFTLAALLVFVLCLLIKENISKNSFKQDMSLENQVSLKILTFS